MDYIYCLFRNAMFSKNDSAQYFLSLEDICWR